MTFFCSTLWPAHAACLSSCLRVFKRGRRNGDGNGAGTKLKKVGALFLVVCGCLYPAWFPSRQGLSIVVAPCGQGKIGRVIPEKHKEKERRKRKKKRRKEAKEEKREGQQSRRHKFYYPVIFLFIELLDFVCLVTCTHFTA